MSMACLPPHFGGPDADVCFALIKAAALGTMVTLRPDGLAAEHIPFIVDRKGPERAGLFGHVARASRAWLENDLDVEVLVVFQLADAYISPYWYPT